MVSSSFCSCSCIISRRDLCDQLAMRCMCSARWGCSWERCASTWSLLLSSAGQDLHCHRIFFKLALSIQSHFIYKISQEEGTPFHKCWRVQIRVACSISKLVIYEANFSHGTASWQRTQPWRPCKGSQHSIQVHGTLVWTCERSGGIPSQVQGSRRCKWEGYNEHFIRYLHFILSITVFHIDLFYF